MSQRGDTKSARMDWVCADSVETPTKTLCFGLSSAIRKDALCEHSWVFYTMGLDHVPRLIRITYVIRCMDGRGAFCRDDFMGWLPLKF